MLRVFLVIDDYNELIYLQTLLKKLGFDVEGLQNQRKYADVSLGFNPQILVTTSHGKKVDGVMLAQSINKRRGLPKILALKNDNTYTEQDFEMSGVDMVIESPVNPKKLVLALATLGGVDENVLLEKYNKLKANNEIAQIDDQVTIRFDDNGQPIDDVHKVRSAIDSLVKPDLKSQAPSTAQKESSTNISPIKNVLAHDPQREERFKKWQKQVGSLPNQNFDRDKIREFNKKLRDKPFSEDHEQIEADKKQFVRTLFKSKG